MPKHFFPKGDQCVQMAQATILVVMKGVRSSNGFIYTP